MVSREAKLSALLLGAGLTFGVFAYRGYLEGEARRAKLPPSTGDVGVLSVYGQFAGRGPVRLMPDRVSELHRPQELAFVWSVDGTGPREVQIDLEVDGARTTRWADRLLAPAKEEALPLVIPFGERDPDRLILIVTVHAAHAASRVVRYPIALLAPLTSP